MYIRTREGFIRGYSLMGGGTTLPAPATGPSRCFIHQIQSNKYIGVFTRETLRFRGFLLW